MITTISKLANAKEKIFRFSKAFKSAATGAQLMTANFTLLYISFTIQLVCLSTNRNTDVELCRLSQLVLPVK